MEYNCFNEPFADLPYKDLFWDMHGLIFETNIWLLAGSTRFQLSVSNCRPKSTIRGWIKQVDSVSALSPKPLLRAGTHKSVSAIQPTSDPEIQFDDRLTEPKFEMHNGIPLHFWVLSRCLHPNVRIQTLDACDRSVDVRLRSRPHPISAHAKSWMSLSGPAETTRSGDHQKTLT